MQSLLLVTLFTIACVLFPPTATAQNQTRNAIRQARNQIAFKAPSAGQNSQQYAAYPVTTEGGMMPGASSAWNSPGFSNEAFDLSNGATPSNNVSRDTWTLEQSGTSNAYNNSNYSNYSANQAAQGGSGRGIDRVYDTYAMSAADVLAARRAVLSGSFFSYHGTQSSQVSRNR